MASIFDFVRAAALVVGLGFSAQQDRKSWIWGDSVLWGAYALGIFFFPGSLFPGSESAMMSYVTRIFASMIIGMKTMWYLTRNTRDETVVGVTLWSRLISSLLMLIVLSYNYHGGRISEKTAYFDMLAYAMLLLTSVYQFWRGEYRVGGREQKGSVSTILRIIFLMMLMGGLVDMAFPSWVLPIKQLEVMEAVVVRCVGALFIGGSLTALYAPSFRYDDDKSAVLLSNIVVGVFFFISLNLAYFVDGLFDSRETLVMHATVLPVFLAVLGLYLLWSKDSGSQSNYNLRSKSQ